MQYRKLGNSGLKVSSICLGAMTFGEPTEGSMMHGISASEKTSFDMLDRAVEAGVNFVDTANVYGNDGLSERVFGKWLGERKNRNSIVVATKFRFGMGKSPNDRGGSRFHIKQAAEASLSRLGTDRIDLYQIHMQDLDTPEEETLRALDDLVREGKVLYFGASNYAAYRLVDSLWTSKTKNLNAFITLQAHYNLIERNLERELIPACEAHGLGVLPWSPLAGGFLSGKYSRGMKPEEGSRYAKWKERFDGFDKERNWKTIEAVQAIALERSTTPSAVSLAWLLAKPVVSSVIVGARSVEQLNGNLAGADLTLSPTEVKALDDASALELGYPYEFIKNIQGKW